MKTIKLLSVLAILASVNLGLASTNPEHENPKGKTIAVEIQQLLSKSNLLVEEDVMAKVYFTINSKNEIVVLTVNSESLVLEEFIKSRLNYSKVKTKSVQQGKRYVIPVKLEAQL
ncbi:hypothetical protein [Aestuariivivens insulae]|uniref:hypothetical protein n=1 Tax=Aestuariivivens insulae TaxID=1621988 RepID=UPI001F5A9AA1|nr:hypothetical protein [Aestuariivivens insulae]